MNAETGPSVEGLLLQAIGILPLAGLSFLLSRSIRRDYLRYFWRAWTSLALALFSLYFSLRFPVVRPVLEPLYYLGEYVFAGFVLAGCRNLATGARVGPAAPVAAPAGRRCSPSPSPTSTAASRCASSPRRRSWPSCSRSPCARSATCPPPAVAGSASCCSRSRSRRSSPVRALRAGAVVVGVDEDPPARGVRGLHLAVRSLLRDAPRLRHPDRRHGARASRARARERAAPRGAGEARGHGPGRSPDRLAATGTRSTRWSRATGRSEGAAGQRRRSWTSTRSRP